MVEVSNIIFTSSRKSADIKPFTGGIFSDLLSEYTHWGWIDIDVIYGDLSPVAAAVKKYDVVTYPDTRVSCHKYLVV